MRKKIEQIFLPWFKPSTDFAWPTRCSMMRLRSADLRSCSFFNSSAAFLRSNNCKIESFSHFHFNGIYYYIFVSYFQCQLTRSFFFLSGVIKPFLDFLSFDASSMRLRSSARFASISCFLAFFAYEIGEKSIEFKEKKKLSFWFWSEIWL